MKRPKKRVKKPTTKRTTRTKKPKPIPSGTYGFDIESRDFFKPIGVVTGRISAKDPPWTIPKPLSQKPLEKMTRKELMEEFGRFRKYHDQVVADNRNGQKALEDKISHLQLDLAHMGRVRDDAMRTRDQLLEIMTHASKEARFPRS